MALEINIGLTSPHPIGVLSSQIIGVVDAWCREHKRTGQIGDWKARRVIRKGHEPVYVVQVLGPKFRDEWHALYTLAVDTLQDCVAVRIVDGGFEGGMLVGPRSEPYGPFNPEQFVPYSEGAARSASNYGGWHAEVQADLDTEARVEALIAPYGGTKDRAKAIAGGLQSHSVGDIYPYAIVGVGDYWQVWNVQRGQVCGSTLGGGWRPRSWGQSRLAVAFVKEFILGSGHPYSPIVWRPAR